AVSNPLAGAGNVVQSGSGTLTLGGSNTFDGQMLVNAATLSVASANALGSTVGGTVVASGATISLAGVAVAGEPLRLDQSALAAASSVSSWGGGISVNGATQLIANSALSISGN